MMPPMPLSTTARRMTIGVMAVMAPVIGKWPRPNSIDDKMMASQTPMVVGLPSGVFLILKVIQTKKVIRNNRSRTSSAIPP